MSQTRTVLLLASVLLLSDFQAIDACSCQPTHPQEQFCRAEFVIKALVGRAKLVELGDNGEVLTHHKGSDNHVTEESEDGAEIINGKDGDLRDDDGTEDDLGPDDRPAPFLVPDHLKDSRRPAVARGPDSRMPGYSARSAGFRGGAAVAYAPGTSHDASPRRHKRSSVPKSHDSSRRRHGRRGVGDAPGANMGPATPGKRLMVQYKINVVKIFKGLENATSEEMGFLYSPPVPMCNVKFPTDRLPHVIMGKMQYGVMMVRTCDYKVNLHEMSEAESKNLVRNMHFRFKSGCRDCEIKVCNRGGCGTERENPYQCRWQEWWTTMTPEASQFACINAKNGKCKWYNSLDKSMEPEDISKSTR